MLPDTFITLKIVNVMNKQPCFSFEYLTNPDVSLMVPVASESMTNHFPP